MERLWFYIQDNQQKGPVPQSEFFAILQQGIVSKDTHVWTEGMPDWKPASELDIAGSIPQTKPARPTSVTVFGILNIVFGGLGLLCTPVAIAGLLLPQPQGQAYTLPPMLNVFSFISYGLNFIFAFVLLASGIGLLNLKRWARQTSYFYGWFSIIWGVLSTIIVVIIMATTLTGGNNDTAMAIGGMIGGFCGGLFGLIYPIFIVVYMRKPHVIDACSR